MKKTKEVDQNFASTRDQMHTLSLEMKQKHEKTSDASKEKLETQELHKHHSKLASAETQLLVMKMQSNVSQRVSYAVHEINELSKSQRKTTEELKQAKESIEVICEAERQLLDEVGKTKDIVQKISYKEKETMKHIALLENYVATMQTQLQEAKGKLFLNYMPQYL